MTNAPKQEPAESAERILFLNYCIARNRETIARIEKKMRRLRAERSIARAQYQIKCQQFQIRQCEQEILSVADLDANVEFVTSAGKRFIGDLCAACGMPVRFGDKPIVLTRKGGVWAMRCWICGDAKYE